MPQILADGVRLNCLQLSPEQAEPRADIVFVHGLATNLAFWYVQYAVALAQDYRVTLFDLRGHGRSTMSPSGYSVGSLGDDLYAVFDQLCVSEAHLVGHSFGGVVALSFAARHPDRVASVVLADVQTSSTRRALQTRHWHQGEVLEALFLKHDIALAPGDPFFGFEVLTQLSQWIVERGSLPEDVLRLVSPLLGRNGSRTAQKWLDLVRTTRAGEELRQDDGLDEQTLGGVALPVLALFGGRSQAFVTSDQLLQHLPQAKLRVLDGAGHFFPSSHVQETLSEFTRFWDALSPRTTPSRGFSHEILPRPAPLRDAARR